MSEKKKEQKDEINRKHPNLKARRMPQHSAAEKAVLGCGFIDDKASSEIFALLSPSDFYLYAHSKTFEAMREVAVKNRPIDLVTVVQQLEEMGELEKCGGIDYLAEIASDQPSAANVSHYISIVRKNAKLRKLINISNNAIDMAYTGDPDDIALSTAEKDIFALGGESENGKLTDVCTATEKVIETVERLMKDPKAMRGITTGFKALDRKLNGLQRSDLILIAARPGQGKTSIGMNLVQNVVLNGERRTESGAPKPYVCAVFSLEMPAEQLMKRMLCSVGDVDMAKVNAGTTDGQELKRLVDAKNRLDRSKLFIYDSAQITPLEILSHCRRLKREYGLDLVMVDYLQLMSTGKRVESRQLEISEITRTMKVAARELDVPILLLSQMSRDIEKSNKKRRPQMSDLRESGAIEQDADIIIFIYREHDMNDPTVKKEDRNLVELIIAKHRNGEPGSVEMRWEGEKVRFVEVDRRADNSAPSADGKKGDFSGAEEKIPSETTARKVLTSKKKKNEEQSE